MRSLDQHEDWLSRRWVVVVLVLLGLCGLVQAVSADANEACADLCGPLAPDLRAGACYCHASRHADLP